MTHVSSHGKEVAIRDLAVGQALPCDLVDPSGRILIKKGHILEQRIVDRWLENGFVKVWAQDLDELAPPADETSPLLRSYDPAIVQQIEGCTNQAKDRLSSVVQDLASNSQPELAGLRTVFSLLSKAIEQDSDAVLFSAHQEHGTLATSSSQALVNRSVLMSTLGATTAAHMGLSVDDCTTVAVAGVLHDISLFEVTLQRFYARCETAQERQSVLNRHSQLSADLLARCPGISEQVRIVIAQVHEQIDGTGFPHQLFGQHLSAASRILNLVDAFLTLTDPNQPDTYLPADAMAYLAGRTGKGSFDYDCMKALLSALSVYSVGSQVVLDDDRTAVVLRSSKTDPLRPVVRVDGQQDILDLRESSVGIRAPVVDPSLPNRRRLTRSEIQRTLWKPRFYEPIQLQISDTVVATR